MRARINPTNDGFDRKLGRWYYVELSCDSEATHTAVGEYLESQELGKRAGCPTNDTDTDDNGKPYGDYYDDFAIERWEYDTKGEWVKELRKAIKTWKKQV